MSGGSASSVAMRRRLDVPEVHRLLAAQVRMLNDWSEADSRYQADMWIELHRAGDALSEAVYGGPSAWTRLSYWLRPYWHRTDSRVWRWQRRPCRYVVVGPTANARSDAGTVRVAVLLAALMFLPLLALAGVAG